MGIALKVLAKSFCSADTHTHTLTRTYPDTHTHTRQPLTSPQALHLQLIRFGTQEKAKEQRRENVSGGLKVANRESSLLS